MTTADRRRIMRTRREFNVDAAGCDVCVDAPGTTVIEDRQDHRYEAARVQARRRNNQGGRQYGAQG